MPNSFKTIRQTAAKGLISEHLLRQLVKAGKIPYIKSGNRFYINEEALVEWLDNESRRNVRGD